MTELDPNGSFVTFEQAVIDGAEKRAASIIMEAQQHREGELRAASQGNGPEDLETRRQNLLNARSQYAAKLRQDSHRRLLSARVELAQNMFDEVGRRLDAFVASPKYTDYLKAKAALHTDLAKEKLVIRLRAADAGHKELLGSLFTGAAFEEDSSIRFGGFKLVVGQVVFDETLDFAFEEQKKGFYADSGLRV